MSTDSLPATSASGIPCNNYMRMELFWWMCRKYFMPSAKNNDKITWLNAQLSKQQRLQPTTHCLWRTLWNISKQLRRHKNTDRLPALLRVLNYWMQTVLYIDLGGFKSYYVKGYQHFVKIVNETPGLLI